MTSSAHAAPPTVAACETWIRVSAGPKLSKCLIVLQLDARAPPYLGTGSVVRRRQELLRVLGLRPGYARAALWQVECDAAGVVPPGLSSVAGLLPVTSPPGTAPLRFDCTTSGDIIFAGGIWTVAPLHPPPPPPPPPGFGVAPGFGQMVTVPDASTLLSSDSATIDFLRTLASQLNANSLGFSGAARDATSMWISDANDGLTDVQPVTVKLSKRAELANHQFVLDQDTHLTTYKRGVGAPTGNLLSSPPDQASLRAAIFEMPMLADEKARMQRACKRPSVWSNPPLLTAAEKALLGDKESTDTSLREQQEGKCRQILPVLQALSSAGTLGGLIAGIPDAGARAMLSSCLDSHVAELSDAFHLVAYDVTALQKRRKTLLLQAVSGSQLSVEDAVDDADWSLSG